MRVPGHTPLRLQQLQSAYGLFHPRPSKLPQCPQIFIPIGVPQAHGRRGRDSNYWLPPAQTRTCGTTAYGSHLGSDV